MAVCHTASMWYQCRAILLDAGCFILGVLQASRPEVDNGFNAAFESKGGVLWWQLTSCTVTSCLISTACDRLGQFCRFIYEPCRHPSFLSRPADAYHRYRNHVKMESENHVLRNPACNPNLNADIAGQKINSLQRRRLNDPTRAVSPEQRERLEAACDIQSAPHRMRYRNVPSCLCTTLPLHAKEHRAVSAHTSRICLMLMSHLDQGPGTGSWRAHPE